MSVLETVSSIVIRSLSEPHAGVLLGILFGTKATLSQSFKESLLSTGTIHIIALSGMNITMLVIFVQLLLLRFFKRSIANIGAIVVIIGFISVVGVSASVVRAAIMGCISLLAVNFGRKNVPIFTLVLAVSIMLLLNPPWVMSSSSIVSTCHTRHY
jgi:competence protein ComEC